MLIFISIELKKCEGITISGYEIRVCQTIEKKRRVRGKGYYFIGNDEKVFYMKNNKFSNINIVNCDILEKMLYEECFSIIDAFSKTDDNKDVYAFSLYLDEHNQIIVYLNNESEFKKTLKRCIDLNPEYNDNKEAMDLKYSLGDFSFMLTPYEKYFSDKFKKMYDYYQTICWIKNEDSVIEVDKLPDNEQILCAFNEEVFDYRLYNYSS